MIVIGMGVHQPRSVRIDGRRTSMRLERQFWDALSELAKREKKDIDQICTRIARRAGRANLTSAVRVAVMAYFRARASGRSRRLVLG